jgi:sugar/nucleoside kinase (ribokinase family)
MSSVTRILGLGNALVDIMTRLDDDAFLDMFHLPKGSMQLVDGHLSDRILKATVHLPRTMSSGGSAANTIHGLAAMGCPTGFIGKISDDEYGRFFHHDLENSHIRPHLSYSTTETGRAIALISPDKERTFATCLGAAMELSVGDLKDEVFKGYGYIHIEGYMVQNQELLLQAVRLASQHGMMISLDLASYNVVDENVAFLHGIIRDYVDVVFANEEEAKAYTGQGPDDALSAMATECNVAVIKLGRMGSLVEHQGQTFRIEGFKINPVDTTGAGDLYAAGFLYGMVNGFDIKRCGRVASVLAAKVIEVTGARMTSEKWNETFAILSNESLLVHAKE